LLSGARTVVLDEFHERSIHTDLAIAFAREAWRARDDLRLVVMSATIDATAVARYLDDCPVVEVPGRLFPVNVVYRPGVSVSAATVDAVRTSGGAVLVFLPGAAEIRRASDEIRQQLADGTPLLPLHGSLGAEEQDEALVPSDRPRIILATNIAETTITVPDVRVVIDAGLQKVARYDADRGLDSLETERVTEDAARQRAGRAGRLGPGDAVRLWDSRDRLRPHREPDISRLDLSAPLLHVIAWGGDPETFPWFEPPPDDARAHAMRLLAQLGAIDDRSRLTALGRDLRALPLPPRLGRFLIGAGWTIEAARACALLSERHYLPPRHGATSCDLLSAIEHDRDLPPHVLRVARDIVSRAAPARNDPPVKHDEERFRRAVLAAFPDRVARRREGQGDRFLLASGTGARLGRESGVVDGEFIVAVDVGRATPRPGSPHDEGIIRIATAVDREWLTPTSISVEHRFDRASGRVRAVEERRLGAIVLGSREVAADPAIRTRVLSAAAIERGPSDDETQLVRRLALVGHPRTFEALVEAAAPAATSVGELNIAAQLPPDLRRLLDREAPPNLALPSGRTARLTYLDDGRVTAAVKLQELFGLADTPRIGRSRTPVTFELLSPAGRPVQVTSDLRSFWSTGYPEVRKELRARYPRHPWPEDPWTAKPTHRTLRR
jgi:ATP-dependent helicase HrpB